MMNPESEGLGFYGKIPAFGDFISRRLPRQFIEPWDNWLQSSLLNSQQVLGENWLNTFLVSPIWRFVISPGIYGDNAWAGIIMPSVDRVGRYFPLTLVQDIETSTISSLFSVNSDWFDQLETLALSVLRPEFNFDNFDKAFANIQLNQHIDPVQFSLQNENSNVSPLGKFACCYDLDDLTQLSQVFSNFNQQLLAKCYSHYSLWAVKNSQSGRAQFVCFEGMPCTDAYASFLQGQPHHHTWNLQTFKVSNSVLTTTPAYSEPVIPLSPLPEKHIPDILPLPITVQGSTYQPSVTMDTFIPFLESTQEELPSSASTVHQWNSYGKTVVGNKRKRNEDAMLLRPELGIWVVADGMGGYTSGDVASRLIVDTLADIVEADNLAVQSSLVCTLLQKINKDLCLFASDIRPGSVVGSTVVALLVKDLQCCSIWAGDSRLYRLRNQQFVQMTRDHSAVEEYMTLNNISREEAGKMVNTNIITRAIGASTELNLETIHFTGEPGDRYLLCSDGLDKELSDQEMAELMQAGDSKSIVESLIDKALNRDGIDNITAIVVEVK